MGGCEAYERRTHPAGTIRNNDEIVSFSGTNGANFQAIGVEPRRWVRTTDSQGAAFCEQLADVHRIECDLRPGAKISYTIDWLENLQTNSGIWTGSIVKDERDITDTRVFGFDDKIILSRRANGIEKISTRVLHVKFNDTEIYIAKTDNSGIEGKRAQGYILYTGAPDDERRKRIRDVLSYCLGNYLVFLGSSFLSSTSDLVGLTAVSPPTIGSVATIPAQPPSPLGDHYVGEVNQERLEQMANALLAFYDDLKFGSFSWTYWHAVCAPVHMKAAHFGAVLEALQQAYLRRPNTGISRSLMPHSAWEPIEAKLLAILTESDVKADARMLISNKIKFNLNQMPAAKIHDAMFDEMGLALGDVEKKAWKRRNQAAHGHSVTDENAIYVIRETKLLKVIIHRMIMTISGANSQYYDEYTLGRPVRQVTECVPSQ
jgi:hypothetical protein